MQGLVPSERTRVGRPVSAVEVGVSEWRERFERWAAAKTRRASAARLPAYVTELEEPCPRLMTIGNDWTKRLFDGPFYLSPAPDVPRPACSLVFVQSADGNTGADDPGSLGGGETDKHLIYEGLSRVAAHAVLAGAATVRGSGVVFSVWHPEIVRLRTALGFPRHPVQIVATIRGVDPGAELIFNVPELHVIVLGTPLALERMRGALAARPWVVPLAMDPADPRDAFAGLASMGIGRVSCVGGRTFARSLLDADLVDEIYLTTAAAAGGEAGTPVHARAWRGRTLVRKRGTGDEAGVSFEHILPAALTAE
jgi:riboflavin biosynthesis pyrimidine reductase